VLGRRLPEKTDWGLRLAELNGKTLGGGWLCGLTSKAILMSLEWFRDETYQKVLANPDTWKPDNIASTKKISCRLTRKLNDVDLPRPPKETGAEANGETVPEGDQNLSPLSRLGKPEINKEGRPNSVLELELPGWTVV